MRNASSPQSQYLHVSSKNKLVSGGTHVDVLILSNIAQNVPGDDSGGSTPELNRKPDPVVAETELVTEGDGKLDPIISAKLGRLVVTEQGREGENSR